MTEEALRLATTESRLLFDGFASQPLAAARALAVVGQLAATRFYTPQNMIAARIRAADPVVTSEPGQLRFESFSQCCGGHIRFDLLGEGLDQRASARGTTNVDFGAETIEALREVTRHDALRLTVGADEMTLRTFDIAITERRVPLPRRWVQGFGEVQVAIDPAVPVLELNAAAAQRFLRGLPGGRAGQTTYWTAGTGSGIRLSPRRGRSSACVAGPSRLRVLEPLARFARSLTAYADPRAQTPTPTIWVLEIPGGRVSLALSPDWRRGFTGEGGLLLDVAKPSAETAATSITKRLAEYVHFDINETARICELPDDQCRSGIAALSLHGQLGYDATKSEFFWRHLPYPTDLLRSDPPRLRDARELSKSGAVQAHADGSHAVTSDGQEYRVRVNATTYSCTCPWIARHGTSRGPCKHVLAATLSSLGGAEQHRHGNARAEALPDADVSARGRPPVGT